MSRITTNVSNLIAQHTLRRTSENLEVRLQRLSTGLRINRGADDPAGLIVSERLRSEIRAVDQGISNAERASGVIATAEGALAEVSELLTSIKALVVEAANSGAISLEERQANQLQIDSAINSITRISNTASFAGLKLLDGSLDYLTSGINSTNIAQAKINAVNFGTRTTVPVDVRVIGSAQVGTVYISTATSFLAGGFLPSAVTLEIAGPQGVQVLDFASGISMDLVITAINAYSDNTGVVASRVVAGAPGVTSGIKLQTQAFGSEAFVSVRRLSEPTSSFLRTYALANNAPPPSGTPFFPAAGLIATARDAGKDVSAVVNGAVATGRGLGLSVRTPALDLELVLHQTFAQTTVPATTTSFNVTGGGALYQLGPQVTSSQQTNIGVQSLADSRLGGTLITPPGAANPVLQFLNTLKSGGGNDLLSRNFINASQILDTSIDEVSVLRGKLGAFERNTLQTNVRSLQAALENVSAASSQIRDADFAAETSELTRAQILNQAGTIVLQTTNQQAQNVLSLLTGR